jgi:hypothetical protein
MIQEIDHRLIPAGRWDPIPYDFDLLLFQTLCKFLQAQIDHNDWLLHKSSMLGGMSASSYSSKAQQKAAALALL